MIDNDIIVLIFLCIFIPKISHLVKSVEDNVISN